MRIVGRIIGLKCALRKCARFDCQSCCRTFHLDEDTLWCPRCGTSLKAIPGNDAVKLEYRYSVLQQNAGKIELASAMRLSLGSCYSMLVRDGTLVQLDTNRVARAPSANSFDTCARYVLRQA